MKTRESLLSRYVRNNPKWLGEYLRLRNGLKKRSISKEEVRKMFRRITETDIEASVK